MEETANRIVRYIYENFVELNTDKKACALVRFFKTHPYEELDKNLQGQAQSILGSRFIPARTKCLTLLATAGDEPHWNYRQGSTGHQAIPLIDKNFVDRAPMISQLIQQFGLKISTVIDTNPALITKVPHKAFNVFYIPEALGSPHIPAQEKFVMPYQVKSVLGFGGMLPSKELFSVILFSKVAIPQETANHFRWVSAYVRIAIECCTRDNIFVPEHSQASTPKLRK
ncbi:MAG: hypothetical protein AAFQ89_00395 [Cyanobacteria bacterium J06626_18]